MGPLHIMAIRFSSFGDIILNSSLFPALKKRWGQKVYLTLLTAKEFAPLMEGHQHIDQVVGFKRERGLRGLKTLKNLVEEVHQQRPIDLMVDQHGTLRSLAIRLLFPSLPRIAVDKRSPERWLLTGLKINLLSQQGPLVPERPQNGRFGELLLERNLRDFQGLFDFSYSRPEFSHYLTSGLQVEEEEPLSSCGLTFKDLEGFDFKKWGGDIEEKKYICIVPSASFPEKRWPSRSFYELLKLCLGSYQFHEMKFILLAGPQDDFCREFDPLEKEFPGRFYNLQGKTNLLQSIMWVKKASFCVGNDTGLPHFSESVGTPAIFILGPTGEEFGFYPHLKHSKAILRQLWCRPCTTNGKGNCIRSERFCLTQISPEEIRQTMLDLKNTLDKER